MGRLCMWGAVGSEWELCSFSLNSFKAALKSKIYSNINNSSNCDGRASLTTRPQPLLSPSPLSVQLSAVELELFPSHAKIKAASWLWNTLIPRAHRLHSAPSFISTRRKECDLHIAHFYLPYL
jgi:hypothetical protein